MKQIYLKLFQVFEVYYFQKLYLLFIDLERRLPQVSEKGKALPEIATTDLMATLARQEFIAIDELLQTIRYQLGLLSKFGCSGSKTLLKLR